MGSELGEADKLENLGAGRQSKAADLLTKTFLNSQESGLCVIYRLHLNSREEKKNRILPLSHPAAAQPPHQYSRLDICCLLGRACEGTGTQALARLLDLL